MGGAYLARLLSADGVLVRQVMMPMPVQPTIQVSSLTRAWLDEAGALGTTTYRKRVVELLDTDCPVVTYQETAAEGDR